MPLPLSPYAAAKLAGEMYCQAFWKSYGFETVVLRYFNVFGPRQDPSGPYAAVIPLFIKAILAGRQPVIFGDGRQTRDFTYVENVVQANLLAATTRDAAGQVFNVGSGIAYSLLDVLREINRLLGTKIEPLFQPERAGDVRDSLADISRAQDILAYQPAMSFVDGLKRTADFYRVA
jgi:UDP-glucose 4-epimerase